MLLWRREIAKARQRCRAFFLGNADHRDPYHQTGKRNPCSLARDKFDKQ